MLKRILRSMMALVALVVAYQAYVLLAVPWLEPPLRLRETPPLTADERAGAQLSVTKYQRLLSHYFPADHWSQSAPPVVILSGAVMLVLDKYDLRAEYDARTDSRINIVDIERCALVVFPTPFQEGLTPPRDAVIIEAPQGASLHFDEGFRLERFELGQLKHGVFPGKITIRSDMRSPGPEDDLLVETSDLTMNTKLLYTASPVRFRLGPNKGGGQELEIRFLDEEHARRSASGLNLAGVTSLEVRRDVRLRLLLETDTLLPGESRAARPNAERENEQSPVDVTCSGPFHFDFVRYVASFDRDVELRLMHPDGPSDQLSAQQLDVHFLPDQRVKSQESRVESQQVPALDSRLTALDSPDAADRQKHDLGRLKPAFLVAQGYPVVVTSPSREAEARGEQIQLGLANQKVTLRGRQEARLVYGPNMLRAPTIEYQHPAKDARTTLGNFRATGPGSLRYLPNLSKPDDAFLAAWQTSVELGRYQGQPLITLTGRPQFSAGAVGRLTADEVRVHLIEMPNEGEKRGRKAVGTLHENSEPASAARREENRSDPFPAKHDVMLDRLTATGSVHIESPELSGRMKQLVATFRYQDGVAAPASSASQSGDASPFELSRRSGPPSHAYYVESDEVQLEVAMEGKRASPTSLVCKRNVVLREIPLRATDQQPLEVRGGELVASNLDTTAQITIRAASAADPAQLAARGMTVTAPLVELDQQQKRLWIDAPGRATVLATRDLDGQAAANPYPLEVRWQGRLNFDGRTIVFDRDVQVEGPDAWLRCDQLSATLTTPVEFGTSASPAAVDVAEIECRGHVVLDQRLRDAAGPTSHQRMQLPRLVLNQQTGEISGDGPGIVRSAHFATEMNTLGGPPRPARDHDFVASGSSPAVPTSPAAKEARPRLHFLRIDFQRGLRGNLYTRELRFLQRVRTVYGPIDSWEQELDPTRPETLPPEGVLLSCDELRVNEDPLAPAGHTGAGNRPMGPVQLSATGSVRIDGQTANHGTFGAQADSASYAKDILTLRGSPRTPAQLWLRRYPGEEAVPFSAQTIYYDRSTGLPKVDGFQYLEFTPSRSRDATRPATPPR